MSGEWFKPDPEILLYLHMDALNPATADTIADLTAYRRVIREKKA